MSRIHIDTPQIDHMQIEILKPLIVKALEWYNDRTPELNRGNVTHNPNTLILLDLAIWFFQHFDNPSREKALRGLAKFIIIHVDFDAPYRDLFLKVLRKVMDCKWQWPDREPYQWKKEV